jgi:four helix bundle protein
MSEGFRSLKVYEIAYDLAMKIFNISKDFPKEEKYSLADQIRRSSRSVCANIAEPYRKRRYPKHFTSKISDADCEASAPIVWLDFARDCGYTDNLFQKVLMEKYSELGKIPGSMANNPNKFKPR